MMDYSWGGTAASFAAGRDKRILALVSLDGSLFYSPEIVTAADYRKCARHTVRPEQLGSLMR